VHDQAGVRYTRIPDTAHVLSARGGQGGKNEKQIITGRDALLKKSNRIILISRADTVGPSVRKTNKRFFHSFIIHSLQKRKTMKKYPRWWKNHSRRVYIRVSVKKFAV
jgi:hypothetical protein